MRCALGCIAHSLDVWPFACLSARTGPYIEPWAKKRAWLLCGGIPKLAIVVRAMQSFQTSNFKSKLEDHPFVRGWVHGRVLPGRLPFSGHLSCLLNSGHSVHPPSQGLCIRQQVNGHMSRHPSKLISFFLPWLIMHSCHVRAFCSVFPHRALLRALASGSLRANSGPAPCRNNWQHVMNIAYGGSN